jgi:5-methylcytosine-specific restriction endonuclease McrA
MQMDDEGGKVCADCKVYKTADEFYRRSAAGGLLAYCRPCHSRRSSEAQKRRRGDAPLRARNLKAGLPDGMKRCARCDQALPLEAFSLKGSGARRSECPPCHNVSNAEYKRTHRDKVRAADAAYREANREALAARQRQWRADHPEAYTQIHSRWKARNKSAVNAATHRYRNPSIDEGVHHWTAAEWEALKAEFDHRCLMCLCQEPGIKLTADHIVPVSRGGSNDIGNIQPLCKPCNSKKHRGIVDLRKRKE